MAIESEKTSDLLKRLDKIKESLESVPGYDLGNISDELLARFVYPNFQEPGMTKEQAMLQCKQKLGITEDPDVKKLAADVQADVLENREQLKEMYVGEVKELYASANTIRSAAAEVTDTIPTIASSISTLAVQVGSMAAVWTTAAAALPTLKAGVSDIKNIVKSSLTTMDNIKNIGLGIVSSLSKIGASDELLKIFMPIITILGTVADLKDMLSIFSKKADKAEKDKTPSPVVLDYNLASEKMFFANEYINTKGSNVTATVYLTSISNGEFTGTLKIPRYLNFKVGNVEYLYVTVQTTSGQMVEGISHKRDVNGNFIIDTGCTFDSNGILTIEATNASEIIISGKIIFKNGKLQEDFKIIKDKTYKDNNINQDVPYEIVFEKGLSKYYTDGDATVINGIIRNLEVQFGTKITIPVNDSNGCNYYYEPDGHGSEEDTYYTVEEPNPDNIDDEDIDKYNYTYEIKDDSTKASIYFNDAKVKNISVSHPGGLKR